MSDNKNIYEHIIPALKDWPISQFSEDRDGFIKRLVAFTYERFNQSELSTYELVNKTIYLEKRRVRYKPWNVDPSDEKQYFNTLAKELEQTKDLDNALEAQQKLLKRLINRYAEEIIGHFIPKTHLFARKFLTALFKRIFNNGWGRGHRLFWGTKKDVQNKIKVEGYINELRTLFNKGTVVIVPTHYTNLDSIMIGYAIDSNVGIPAFSYGAGLNLYDYELLAYFMNRLGAYRVDRRKKNPIYLETLKSMASLSITEGLNHIFFPGGTRSRSGAIEDKLKLGLLNSVIDAQRHCVVNQLNKKIFVVPLTIGYHFIFEAGGLIHQHLKAEGKEKYTGQQKRSSIIKNILFYFRQLRKNDSEVYLSFGKPMDILGNEVDINGTSIDARGKEISIEEYFSNDSQVNVDTQRESVYTRMLASKIVESFKKENIVLSSHLLAFSMFKSIEKIHPGLDLYEVLKLRKQDTVIQIEDCKDLMKQFQSQLKLLVSQGKTRIAPVLNEDVDKVFRDGLKYLGIYHQKRPIKLNSKGSLVSEDLKLLYYYHNKLIHLPLEA